MMQIVSRSVLMRFGAGALLAGGLAVGAAGCSGGDGIKTLTEGKVRALVATSSGGAGKVSLAGRLAVNDAGCLAIATADGRVLPVVWPKGSALAEEGGLVSPDGDLIAVGGHLSADGGPPAAGPGEAKPCLAAGADEVFRAGVVRPAIVD